MSDTYCYNCGNLLTIEDRLVICQQCLLEERIGIGDSDEPDGYDEYNDEPDLYIDLGGEA